MEHAYLSAHQVFEELSLHGDAFYYTCNGLEIHSDTSMVGSTSCSINILLASVEFPIEFPNILLSIGDVAALVLRPVLGKRPGQRPWPPATQLSAISGIADVPWRSFTIVQGLNAGDCYSPSKNLPWPPWARRHFFFLPHELVLS